jgi:hypothetical protein
MKRAKEPSWSALAKRLSRADIELTVEEFAIVAAACRARVRAGRKLDPVLAALVEILARQILDADREHDHPEAETAIGDDDLDAWPAKLRITTIQAGPRSPNARMSFDVDGEYSVSIAARPLILDGQPCRAKIDLTSRRIQLSDQLPRRQRRQKLLHELAHAWRDHHAKPADDESEADDLAAFADAMLTQYLAQGGDPAMESLDPEHIERDRHFQQRNALAGLTFDCGYCHAPASVGSIENGPPKWNEDLGGWTVERRLRCELCDRLTIWTETSSSDGKPFGEILPWPKPRVERDMVSTSPEAPLSI